MCHLLQTIWNEKHLGDNDKQCGFSPLLALGGILRNESLKYKLEEMFSDCHLAEDGFLLKHIQRNKQGFVSLKLLTCLKKVNIRLLTTNWYMTLAAVEYSDILELNDDCTKVRRKEPLPQWLMSSPTSRFVLVRDTTREQDRVEAANSEQPSLLMSILQRFDAIRDLASVWILTPGEELPKELQCYAKHHKELGQVLCAVIKFNSLGSVRRAFSSLREEKKINKRGLFVVSLGWQSMQSIGKFKPWEKNKGEGAYFVGDALEVCQVLAQKPPPSPLKFSEENPEANLPQACQDNSSCSGKSLHGFTKRYSWTNGCSGDRNTQISLCPWVLKRKAAVKPETSEHLKPTALKLIVLRQPFGPDGTKGFQTPLQQTVNVSSCSGQSIL
uniref:Uncharacterized protein n=1 Tax=Cyprinodon variegatus TaxID=28743 RepID=A0A3Q2E2Q2_CYPVA